MAQPREPDRIQCLECGLWYRALPSHLRHTHAMTDEDYRLKHGVPAGVPLVCLEWSERAAEVVKDMGLDRNLTAHGPSRGYTQRESVKQHRQSHYARIAEAGMAAAHAVDKTAERREKLRPYPVTVSQAAERLGCTTRAAYNFLSYCVITGRLARTGRGRYDEVHNA